MVAWEPGRLEGRVVNLRSVCVCMRERQRKEKERENQ